MSIEKVIENGLCIGCGGCAVATQGRISVEVNDKGLYQASLEGVDAADRKLGSKACPFSDDSLNEDELSDLRFDGADNADPVVGKYKSIMAGGVTQPDFRLEGSSGGMTGWTAVELLRRGLVDGVIHAAPVSEGGVFEYQISTSPEEYSGRRKSMYYSVSFAAAVQEIRGNGKSYAFVGLPCFVRSIRSLVEADEVLKQQLKYFLGLVCGHLKTRGFAESLAWQGGIAPENLRRVDFRVKNSSRGASGYDFGASDKNEGQLDLVPRQSLLGGNWGHGFFQPEACNFCDDIFAETADVVFGDAWLPQYDADWRGTNVVVTRHPEIEKIYTEAMESGDLTLEELDVASAIRTQGGNVRHRRYGLQARLADDQSEGKWTPRKRVKPGYANVSKPRLRIIRKRRLMSKQSIERFHEAKLKDDLSIFTSWARQAIGEYRELDRQEKLRDPRVFAKRLVGKIVRKIGVVTRK